jgi:hypothetical protein
MAFEPGHLDLQFNATLADRHRLMLQQPEGVDFLFLGSAARHLVERVLYPPRTATQMLCHAEIAFHGADKDNDGSLSLDNEDCWEGPIARLLLASMAYFGGRTPA